MGAGGQENATQFRCWSNGIRSDMEQSWDPSRVAARTLLVTTSKRNRDIVEQSPLMRTARIYN